MPILQNKDYEIFAQGVARGLTLADAFADTGLESDHRNAARLAKTPTVSARIAELRALHLAIARASPLNVVASLVRMAESLENDGSPAALKEARQHLIEASRLFVDAARVDRPRLNYGMVI